ncbi:putative monooxygenase p33MONOX [Coregonus clupeaformis]|uniref:putative monooxygenase p33MONOX n=1 Tax=Coregonus clupeaformis TaxID=59861 RepID=UPI001E1C28B6|nr:putative monooxygenase p33MONOX [Coregonus clupeaformis]XP_045082894.1 putative monooxygenase p33MONOX [Coregonus clupeaformis]
MGSRQGDIPALESGVSGGFFGGFSSPIGMSRRAFSYDEALDAPMHSPPPDMCVNNPWNDPLIPQRKFKRIAEEDESGNGKTLTFSAAPVKPPVPVVKAKASSLMNTLMIKQTQESLQRFELQAGLTEAGYTPHKGLSVEDTQFHRLAEGPMPKLRMPSGDFKEDRLSTSAQSTPCGTPSGTPSVTPSVSPHSSPILNRRSWFNRLSPAPFLATPELGSPNFGPEMGGNEGGGAGGERWSFFGTSRPVVQKSSTDPGSETNTGFTLQSYFGVPKSNTMEGIKTQVNLMVDDPAKFNPPKIEISGIEGKRPPQTRPHKLKPRDMNVLTPSGF